MPKLDRTARRKNCTNDETRKRLDMRRRFLERCYRDADKIFDAQMKLALGHWQALKGPDGQIIDVALKPPDAHALSWIMDQMWGKAKQPIDLDARVETIVQLTDETAKALTQAIKFALPENDADPD